MLSLEKDTCEENKLHSPELGCEIYTSKRPLLSSRVAPWITLWIETVIRAWGHPTDGDCVAVCPGASNRQPAHTAMLSLLAESAANSNCQACASSKVCFVTTLSGLLHPGWLVCLLWLPRDSILETVL